MNLTDLVILFDSPDKFYVGCSTILNDSVFQYSLSDCPAHEKI